MANKSFDEFVFQHLIDFPNRHCVYCSAKETTTGRTKIFLIFNELRRIYIHNGSKNSWDELRDEGMYDKVRVGFNRAVSNNRIPYMTTLSNSIEGFCFDQLN